MDAAAGVTPDSLALPRGGPRPGRSLEVLRRRERRIGSGQPRPGLRRRPDRARPRRAGRRRREVRREVVLRRGPGEPLARPRQGRLHARRLGAHRGIARRRPGRPGEQVRPRRPARAELVHQERGRDDEQSGQRPQRPLRHRRRHRAGLVRPRAARQRRLRDGDGGPRRQAVRGHLRGRSGRGGTRLPLRRRLAVGRLRSPRPLQRRHLARGLRRQALRGHGPLPPGRLRAAGIDEREPGRQDRPLRRRRQLGRLRSVARRRRPSAGWSVFRGELYASSLYKPAGFFRYRGGDAWQRCPLPADGRRVVALGVFNGHLYAGSYDSCSVCRFDGKSWEDLGVLESTGQTYSFEVHAGRAVRRDLAERAGLPVRPGRAVGLGRPAGGGEGGHGDGRPQRQALRRDAPAGGGLSLRRRHATGPGPAGST